MKAFGCLEPFTPRPAALWAWLLGAALVCHPLLARPAPAPRPWKAHEARHARIQKIVIEIGDVFDLANPAENRWYGRLADKLHASTHEAVIRKTLLFQEGDLATVRRIYETERLLRALPFVKDAHITPVTAPDGTLIARVQVRDAWTTQVNANFASVGGQRTMSLGLDEKNFLGMGKSVSLDYAKDPARTTSSLSYLDPQLFGSRWTLGLKDAVLSDGLVRSVNLTRPFYALDTPWSTSVAMSQQHSNLYLYDQGAQIFKAPFFQDDLQWGGARLVHEVGDRVWRAGVIVDRQDTHYGAFTASVPPGILAAPAVVDRRLRGVAATFATQRDAFDSFVDIQGMDTPEDYNLSLNGSLELGYYSPAMGSSMSAPFFLFQAADGWSRSPDDLTLLTVSWDGRMPATGLENSSMSLALSDYHKVTPNQILAAYAAVNLGHRLDPERWYYLGGNQGMRGFPNYLHPGDASWQVSCDYRMLTGQRWGGLVRLGYSAFVDMGAIRQLEGLGWSRVYSDAGLALRLGNLKSSLGRVILVSFGVPLNREPYQNRWQFTIGNTMQF